MKQFVIDQMKEYQHKQNMIKAVKYQEGMEDAWMVEYEAYIEDNEDTTFQMVNKIFWTKEEARKYIASPTDETIRSDFCKYTAVVPVLLHVISRDEYDEYDCFVVSDESNYYEYEKIEDNCWLTMENSGIAHSIYDSEDFFEYYETPTNKSIAHIGYDRDLEELYVEMNSIRIAIDSMEIPVIERLFDAFGINYDERIGQFFKYNN